MKEKDLYLARPVVAGALSARPGSGPPFQTASAETLTNLPQILDPMAGWLHADN